MPLKYLGNVWRTLNIPLINCERNLILTWSENCVLTSKATIAAVNNPINAIFKITDTKLYIPVVTLSTKMIIIF